jgi:hypothetical protein
MYLKKQLRDSIYIYIGRLRHQQELQSTGILYNLEETPNSYGMLSV